MTPNEKEQRLKIIRDLNARGWSGPEIAYNLKLSRSGLMAFCHRNDIRLRPKKGGRQDYLQERRPRVVRTDRRGTQKATFSDPSKLCTHVVVELSPDRVRSFEPICTWHGCKNKPIAIGKPYCSEHHIKGGGMWG